MARRNARSSCWGSCWSHLRYENENFTFTIPADWATMEEVWGRPMTSDIDTFALGVEEIITIQYPPYQRQGDVFFTAAASPLGDGEDLESRFAQAYKDPAPEIKNFSRQAFEKGDLY